MKKIREYAKDLAADTLGSFLIAVGIYNFAAASEFPVAGISGIAMLFYYFWKIPIGIMTIVLNVPIILFCYRYLGRQFFIKSAKTMVIYTFIMDVIAPMLPVYKGDLILSCICMGVCSGFGYALIYMRDGFCHDGDPQKETVYLVWKDDRGAGFCRRIYQRHLYGRQSGQDDLRYGCDLYSFGGGR